jgi:hypothetical protein
MFNGPRPVNRARIARFVSLLLTILAAVSLSVADAATVLPTKSITEDGESTREVQPRVAHDPAGNVHVVWRNEAGPIYYSKGIWNNNQYTFGSRFQVADVAGFGYARPNVAVAPNGTIMVAWSPNFNEMSVQTWNSNDNQPSGPIVRLPNMGNEASMAADKNNVFHIAGSFNENVQYCQFNGTGCSRQDVIDAARDVRPDIAVDSNNNIHLIWDVGQEIWYSARPANGNWGSNQRLGNGQYSSIATDLVGGVHLAWSGAEDIQYCRKAFGTACESRTFDYASDVRPAIGASNSGNVMLAWRDAANRDLVYNTFENGQWGSSTRLTTNITNAPDVNGRSYSGRFSVVWDQNYDIQHSTLITPRGPCEVSPTSVSGLISSNAIYKVYLPILSYTKPVC